MCARWAVACLMIIGLTSCLALAEAGDVTITYYGHAMFTIAFEGGPTVLTDPFEPGLWGMTYPIGPMDGIDVVTASHEHADHNYAQLATGSPVVLRGVDPATGVIALDREVDGVRFYTVATCHSPGSPCDLSDANAIFVIEGNGLRIAHLGDLSHVLTDEQAAAVGVLDIILIPTGGGGPTIEPLRANQVLEQLQPTVILAMHYETPELGWNITPIEPFLEGKTTVEIAERDLIVNAGALPEEPTVFVLPYQ